MTEDTLVALCTAQGQAALSVLRLSGPKALSIGRAIAMFLPEKPESHKVYFGTLKHKGQKLDEVLLTYFSQGKSFTGEETLEISCHGGGVYRDILESLIEEGARPAKRGEFSLQAFSNGKMDLAQVEGLGQLIESESKIARAESLKQLKGELSKKLLDIEKKWLFLLSHVEADIDFSLENLNTLSEDQIQKEIQNLLKELDLLLSNYQPFDKLQKGLVFGLFGSTNAGKSSLFNALLREERAIVSEEEGTTRDIVEASLLNPKGLNLLLKDCAGFRDSESHGEKKGQEKSLELFKNCDYRCLLVDGSFFKKHFRHKKPKSSTFPLREGSSHFQNSSASQKNGTAFLEKELALACQSLAPQQKTWLVITKIDLLDNSKEVSKTKALEEEDITKEISEIKDFFETKSSELQELKIEKTFFVSSLTKKGLSHLKEQMLACGNKNQESFLITNSRHHEALQNMKSSLLQCQKPEQKKSNKKNNKQKEKHLTYEEKSLDIIALNLQEGLMSLYEILGKQVDDKVLDQIFKKFCIGK